MYMTVFHPDIITRFFLECEVVDVCAAMNFFEYQADGALRIQRGAMPHPPLNESLHCL